VQVYIVAITTQQPPPGRHALEVPEIESRRVGLSAAVRKWIMLDEINMDIPDQSYVWEDRKQLGAFSPSFTRLLQARLVEVGEAGAAKIIDRT
jgi:hypothetical protein